MMKKWSLLIILFTIHFSLFTAYSQSWQSLIDSTKFYQEKQDFQTALQWAEKAEVKAKAEFGEKDTNYIKSLTLVYLCYYYMGKTDKAIYYCEKLKPIIKEVKGSESLEYAGVVGDLGAFYIIVSNNQKAEINAIESLKIKRNIYKEDNPDLISPIINLAFYYNNQGNYKNAESLFKEALEMSRRIYKSDNPKLATSINNMAGFYDARGNKNYAAPLYAEALEMRRRLFKGDHPDLATSLNNMAMFYNSQGNYESAEQLFKDALEMRRRIFKGDHPLLALSLDNIAVFYNHRGNFSDAEQMFKESLDMYRRLFKGDHPDLAKSISFLALFYEARGYYKLAGELYTEALEMNKRIFNYPHPKLINSLSNMAIFYDLIGNYSFASSKYSELFEALNYTIQDYFPVLNENEKELFYNNYKSFYESYPSFVSEMHLKNQIEEKKDIELLYNNLLFSKALILSSTNKVTQRILNSGDSTLVNKFQIWKDLKTFIGKNYNLSKQQLEKKHINLDSLINLAGDKEKELSRLSEDFAKEYEKKKVSWEDVKSQLKLDDAAIEIVRFKYFDKNRWTDTSFYAALIIKNNSKNPELVLLKNGNDLEEKYIKNYKRSILNKLEDKDSYTQFWEPIAKKLKGIKRVYISPDGVYNQINLATLMNPKTEHFLSDDNDIRVVTSTRDLVERKMDSRFRGNDTLPPIVELFGDPMFNLDSTKHLELANAIAENRTREFYYLGNTLDSTTRGGIRPLPSTRTEIEQIANEFTKKGWKVNSHLGEKALEEAVKGVDNPKVLHIATHGKFLKDVEVKEDDRMLGMETKRVAENPLLRSFLLFSGAENTLNNQKIENQNTDDGLLTAYEAMNLNLDNTDLVVLSACETGLGEIKNGEGVYGLQRAFQQAGAKSIIMSLWTVPDKETQELMTSFYTKWLNGKDKRTAFNEARNEMRDKYHYPYYWGGFVMVGE